MVDNKVVDHSALQHLLISLSVGKGYITQTRPCNILHFFTAEKNDNFQMKNCDIFLIFAQNIDCGYTLEPPQ